MADERKIVIELKPQDVNKSVGDGEKKNKQDSYDLSALAHPIKYLEKNTIGKNVIAYQAYSLVKQQIKTMAMYEINKYFSLTENYTAQQNMNNALTAISKVASFGTTVVGGAMTGSALGPYGAAAGAIVAAVGWTVNESIQVYQRFDQQRRDLATMNTQSQFQLTRMGLVDGGRNSQN